MLWGRILFGMSFHVPLLGCEIVRKWAKGQKIFRHMVRGGVSLVRSSKVVAGGATELILVELFGH